LENQLKNGEDWSATVDVSSALIPRHVDEEESTIFPELRAQLGGDGLPEVSGQISREEALIL
jgi:hemerythrin-like domain-containing protein